jgi:hypothetical protein
MKGIARLRVLTAAAPAMLLASCFTQPFGSLSFPFARPQLLGPAPENQITIVNTQTAPMPQVVFVGPTSPIFSGPGFGAADGFLTGAFAPTRTTVITTSTTFTSGLMSPRLDNLFNFNALSSTP